MDTSSAGTRRLCVAVDQERYSHRDNVGQFSTQRRLVDVMRQTSQGVLLPGGADWAWQSQGDGALGVLPAGVDEPRAVADILHELGIAVYQQNRDLAEHARLRLRLAMHSGIVHEAANGYAGDAVVVACRLLDAEELKAALRRHREADLALIVSAQLYDDVIRHNYRDLRAETFQRVEVSHPRKGFTASAWIHVPVPSSPTGPTGSAGNATKEGDGATTDGATTQDGDGATRGGSRPDDRGRRDDHDDTAPWAEDEPDGSGPQNEFVIYRARDLIFDQRGAGRSRGHRRGDADD